MTWILSSTGYKNVSFCTLVFHVYYVSMKKIIADPNIPLLENFDSIGSVIQAPGREWTNDLIRDADILLTRSVTTVNANLLQGSQVKFVGTATSGFDHVDRQYLDQHGIHFSFCPGSNANSVAEYVLSAILVVTEPERSLQGMTAGIIGCGHVGGRVAELLQAVGINTILNDPPLKDQTGDDQYRTLQEALSADIVTLHTPLTSEGKHPTCNLITDQQLQQMKPNVIFMNAARGGIVDEKALLKRIKKYPQMKTVIDCWKNEPAIDHDLLRNVTLGTPHIAGYSYDGKVKATKMLYTSLCDFLEIESDWHEAENHEEQLMLSGVKDERQALCESVFSCYDIRIDDHNMKGLLTMNLPDSEIAFDQLRKEYRLRREFGSVMVKFIEYETLLDKIGFRLVKNPE